MRIAEEKRKEKREMRREREMRMGKEMTETERRN
jgi:hypothetical protein